MSYINNWHKAHHFHSVQVALIGAVGALLGGIGSLLSGVSSIVPWLHVFLVWFNEIPRWAIWFGALAFCAGIIFARIVKQSPFAQSPSFGRDQDSEWQ